MCSRTPQATPACQASSGQASMLLVDRAEAAVIRPPRRGISEMGELYYGWAVDAVEGLRWLRYVDEWFS